MNVIRSLLEDIKTKQLQCYGHVQRMEEGSLPKEVMKWRPPGKRKRGRPKLTCAEGINPLNAELNPICHLLALLGGATILVVSRLRVKGLMGEKGMMEEDWNDRSNWRKKIL